VALGVILLDQVTKVWAVAALSDGPNHVIDGFFQLRVARNPGAAFSSFQTGGPVLGLVAVVMAIVILVALGSTERRVEAAALGSVMGGALGNFLDRVFRGDGFLDGAVVDFLDFSFFPSFNVADSGITVGVILLLILSFVGVRPHAAG
jgi:signal peptidase II